MCGKLGSASFLEVKTTKQRVLIQWKKRIIDF